MSTPEPQLTLERRSSVQISENSKGEPAVTVKAYAHDHHLLEAARAAAVATYKAVRDEVRP